MPQIRAFWLQAHDRPTSTLTMKEIYQALDALPEPDPDRQSRRGYKATADYYRAQRPKRSGRRKGGQAPKTQVVKMLCRLFVDAHRRADPFSEPAGGRALREFVYAGLEYIDGKLAQRSWTTEKSIDHAFARLKRTILSHCD
jgi:hypothetical protein